MTVRQRWNNERDFMSMKTGLLRRMTVVAAFSGVVLALSGGAASAEPAPQEDSAYCQTGGASELSPSTQKAWADFICGGGNVAGGLARMISGVWVGAPGTLIAGVTGKEMSPEQLQAWWNWNRGADQAGKGAAMIISGVYVGAPGYILDKISGGATPADLSELELEQVSFLMPIDSPQADAIPGGRLLGDPMALLGAR